MKPTGYNEFLSAMLDKPSVLLPRRCAICGRFASDAHHLIEKGSGGVSPEVERRIPKMTLCGTGNLSGCHGDYHGMLLHIYWSEGLGGWVYHRTKEPVNHFLDWYENAGKYRPVPAWVEQRRWGDVIGRRS